MNVTFRIHITCRELENVTARCLKLARRVLIGGQPQDNNPDKARSLRHSATAASPRVLARRDDHVRRSYISGSRSWARFKQLTPPVRVDLCYCGSILAWSSCKGHSPQVHQLTLLGLGVRLRHALLEDRRRGRLLLGDGRERDRLAQEVPACCGALGEQSLGGELLAGGAGGAFDALLELTHRRADR